MIFNSANKNLVSIRVYGHPDSLSTGTVVRIAESQHSTTHYGMMRGHKHYELSNLPIAIGMGNVLVVITDQKHATCQADTITHYTAQVTSATDYSPFGAPLAGRTWYGDMSGRYRFGFNGMERDNQTYGVGNAYDFGARVYSSRLAIWLSVDKRFKEYVPFSPYIFALNCPIILKDADGNVVIDGNGRPVRVSIKQAEDGTVTANFDFEEGTSQEIKDKFNNNAGRVIKAMIQTKTGQQVVNDMNESLDHINIEISDERPLGDGGNLKLGDTDIEAYGQNARTGESYKVLKIKIYQNNIDQATKDGDSEQSDKWENAKMNKERKIGAVGVHEGTHATKHFNGKGYLKARLLKEHEAKAEEYKAIEEYGELNN